MGQRELLAGDQPQPEEERQRRLGEELVEPPARLDARLLHDVGRVDPSLDARVEPQPHHAIQPEVYETQLRVRYAETDQMGVVYHSNYIVWFEVGRVEMLRQKRVGR